MNERSDPRFLALLVHRGLVSKEAMAAALASGRPRDYLLRQGIATPAQWEEWQQTGAGLRPHLSRYELGDVLGEGGTARVFRARDRVDGRTVALKLLNPELARDAEARAAFVREAKLLVQLTCPNIVKGYRVAHEGASYYCAMELIDGVCLQDQLGEGRRLAEALALRVVMQIGTALSHMHAAGLVHRDVKPGNIMLERGGRAVLIDLGFAVRQRGAGAAPAADTTAGTVHYISPEQAKGRADLDVRADIYSLGATLYHLVTGSLPFAGATHEEVMAKQVLEALSGDAIRALGLAPQTHYFIEKMMAKEKEIRFQDPDQLVVEIGRYLEAQEHARAAEAEAEALARHKSRRRLRRFR